MEKSHTVHLVGLSRYSVTMSYCNLIKPSILNVTDFNLNQELKEKHLQYAKRHDRVILFHNNARSHVAESMKEGTWMSYPTCPIH